MSVTKTPSKTGLKTRLTARSGTPFWKRKTLEQMTPAEWESLCDGCGRCCLNKLEEEDTGKLYFTDVACKLLDHGSCRCSSYKTRFKKVPDCVSLTPKEVRAIDWLPPTCAYDLLAKGKDLYWWHPLVSGDPDTVHTAGVSVRGRVGASEADVPDAELENWIVKWPGKVPKGARASAAPSKEPAARAAASIAKERARVVAVVKGRAKPAPAKAEVATVRAGTMKQTRRAS
jgi:uncharacterized cysteine cluster protein YcgN (CxxCxxCC family)